MATDQTHPPRLWTAPSGITYRILDCVWVSGEHRYRHTNAPGPASTMVRIFRPATGERLRYSFRSFDRDASDAVLEAQWQEAHPYHVGPRPPPTPLAKEDRWREAQIAARTARPENAH
jgi:hypothetical protein